MTKEELRAELEAIYASPSWKITAPLRTVSALTQSVFVHLRRPRVVLFKLLRRIASISFFRRIALLALSVSPRLKERVKRHYANKVLSGLAIAENDRNFVGDESSLPRSARDIFLQLRATRRQQR
jgi:hypothetical protein